MHTSPLRCPECGRSAQLLISDRTATGDDRRTPRRRHFRLSCPTGCTPSSGHLARLADPMAC